MSIMDTEKTINNEYKIKDLMALTGGPPGGGGGPPSGGDVPPGGSGGPPGGGGGPALGGG
jgi:hypothetical protein